MDGEKGGGRELKMCKRLQAVGLGLVKTRVKRKGEDEEKGRN